MQFKKYTRLQWLAIMANTAISLIILAFIMASMVIAFVTMMTMTPLVFEYLEQSKATCTLEDCEGTYQMISEVLTWIPAFALAWIFVIWWLISELVPQVKEKEGKLVLARK